MTSKKVSKVKTMTVDPDKTGTVTVTINPETEIAIKTEPEKVKVAKPVAANLPKCNRCGSTDTVHTHNSKEGGPPELLCRPCHRKEHGQPPE